ncbi:amidase [Actinomycetes bacterium KLBMP 9797]
MDSVLRLSAVEAVRALKRGEVSPLELVDAVADRLDEVEPVVNALVARCLDRARANARRLMSDGDVEADHPAWLAGLPVTVKDVVDVAGLPTTFGSPLYRDRVADRSDPLVARIERRGAIVVGKTNLPEFCSGADTVSPVSGRTANPVDPAVSCGASSGGAAASVAAGAVWCAHGTDTAGSIRIPAAFCGTVGLRPTPGLVPGGRGGDPLDFEVHGPLARNVADTELFFAAMAGAELPPAEPVRRVAVSLDLGGTVPVDDEIRRVCARAVADLKADEAAPPLDGVHEACLTLLGHRAQALHGARVDRWGEAIGPALRAEVDAGRRIPPDRLDAARRTREWFRHAVATFFAEYDVLVTPTFGVPPWPVPDGFATDPARIAAVWPLTTLAPMAGCPALTIPVSSSRSGSLIEELPWLSDTDKSGHDTHEISSITAGLPVGLQVMGAPGSEVRVLRVARELEGAL